MPSLLTSLYKYNKPLLRAGFSLVVLLIVTTLFVMPMIALAETTPEGTGQLVPCDGEIGNKCTLNHVFVMIDRIVDFLVLYITVPLASVSFAIAGIYYVVSPANESSRSTAKDIMMSAFLGLVFSFGAWAIVNTLLTVLAPGYSIGVI